MIQRGLKMELVYRHVIYTEVFNKDNLDLSKSIEDKDVTFGNDIYGTDGVAMRLYNNFDFTVLPNKEYHLYHYMELYHPHLARVMMGLDYYINDKKPDWDTLFCSNNMDVLVSMSITCTCNVMTEHCKKNNIALLHDFKMDEGMQAQMTHELSKQICETYYKERKDLAIINLVPQTHITLPAPQNSQYNVLFNVTIILIDEILFNNKAFNRKHNCKVFFEKLNEIYYYTMRIHVIKIFEEDIDVSDSDMQCFLIVLQCALQVLLGDKGDLLIPVIEERGVNKETRSLYFKAASFLLDGLRGDDIFPEPVDWNALIR